MNEELAALLSRALPDWLPHQHWFTTDGARIKRTEIVHIESIVDDPPCWIALVDVTSVGRIRRYQLLLARHEGAHGPRAIGEGYYEATEDPDVTSALPPLFGNRAGFVLEPGVELTEVRTRPGPAGRVSDSIVFGSAAVLELFRQVSPGPNWVLESHRALAAAGGERIAEPLGTIQLRAAGEPHVLGILRRFLADAVDGWNMATASIRDLFAEADLHAEEVGGDFAGEAFRLGKAVAEVHVELAEAFGTERTTPDQILETMRAEFDRIAAAVPELAEFAPAAHEVYEAARGEPLTIQRIHGELGLGTVLRATSGWVITGLRPVWCSPLADIAGLLRSFDEAAHQPNTDEEGDAPLRVRAMEWTLRNIDAFCAGYAESAADPRASLRLLRAFELDKAVHEAAFEYEHRPDWARIPLEAIGRMLG